MSGFDHATYAQAFKRPGMDPRQWISYATVDPETPDKKSVAFEDADGNPSPYGPMVNCTLQPTGISLAARVAYHVAGDGEGEWYPFVAGDELLVAIPEGSERAGAVIIGRLNQELDKWPTVVAGQKSTDNKFGFRRMRAPYIVETAAAYLIRSALTGSQIGIDGEGKVIVNDGDRGSLMIGPEAIGLSNGDGDAFVTVFPPTKEVYLGADSATLLLNATESKFLSTGSISFATSGGMANGTAVTAEQVVALIVNVIAMLASTGSFAAGPLSPANWLISSTVAIDAVVTPAVLALAGVVPFAPTAAVASGAFPPPLFGSLFGPAGAISSAFQNPVAGVDVTGTVPGFGRPGMKL
jgi:hypothetical protein